MIIQGNLNQQLKTTHPPRNNKIKTKNQPEGKTEENERTTAARPLYTLVPAPIEDADLSLVDCVILTHLIKNSYFQSSTNVMLSYSILSKITKVDHIPTLTKHLEDLEKNGYYRIMRTVGQTNIYCLDVDRIETEFNFKIENYYKGYNERTKRNK